MADQVKSKMSEEQKELLETSNILNESSHELKRARTINFMKNQGEQGEENFGNLDLLEIIGQQKDNIITLVLKKFNSKKATKKSSSFFVQQIHVQPPDGINATVAAPLTPGGGWAPSIPNPHYVTSGVNSLKDMTL